MFKLPVTSAFSFFYTFLTATLLSHSGCGKESVIGPDSFKSSVIDPGQPVFSVSADDNSVTWCAGSTSNGDTCNKVFSIDRRNSITSLAAEADGPSVQTMPSRKVGGSFCWVKYGQSPQGTVSWALIISNALRAEYTVYSNHDNPALSFPNFEMDNNRLVFDAFIPDGKDSYDSPLMVCELSTGRVSNILRIKDHDILDPSLHGDEAVFCILSLKSDGTIRSRIGIYNLATGVLLEPAISDQAWQPSMNRDFIIFKEADSLYNYGIIKLYNRRTGAIRTLTKPGSQGEQPFIGSRYTAWESPLFDRIEGWDTLLNRRVIFRTGTTGKPFLKDNTLVWIEETAEGKAVIRHLILLK